MSDEQVHKNHNVVHKSTEIMSAKDVTRMRFVDGILDGKTMVQAALDAGYSESTARQATRAIMPQCRELLQQALQERIGISKLADKIKEGLEAYETKVFADKGTITDKIDLISWSERRLYAELAADLMGLKPDKSGVSINAAGTFQVAVMYGSADTPQVVVDGDDNEQE